MKTPAGTECKFYYEDFNRGRSTQECRCPKAEESLPWKPEICEKCPIPGILRSNASPNLELVLNIKTTLFGMRQKLEIYAFCEKHDIAIEDPYVGCEHCNEERPGLDLFSKALDELE